MELVTLEQLESFRCIVYDNSYNRIVTLRCFEIILQFDVEICDIFVSLNFKRFF